MNEPNWAKVLEYLYQENSEIYPEVADSYDIIEKVDIPSVDKVVKKTGLAPEEITEILEEMGGVGLVNKSYPTINISDNKRARITVYDLSTKGFDVAHEREISKSRHKISKKSSRLSAYLVLGIIAQVTVSFTQPQSPTGMILTGLIIFGIVVAVGFEVAEEPLRLFGNWIQDKLF